MPLVRFVEADGAEHTLEVRVGENLKQAAVDHMIPGITGDCGGFASCGTCHGYVDERFLPLLEPPTDDEEMMLEGLLAPVNPRSRLTCQLTMTVNLDGVVVHLPEEQG